MVQSDSSGGMHCHVGRLRPGRVLGKMSVAVRVLSNADTHKDAQRFGLILPKKIHDRTHKQAHMTSDSEWMMQQLSCFLLTRSSSLLIGKKNELSFPFQNNV